MHFPESTFVWDPGYHRTFLFLLTCACTVCTWVLASTGPEWKRNQVNVRQLKRFSLGWSVTRDMQSGLCVLMAGDKLFYSELLLADLRFLMHGTYVK